MPLTVSVEEWDRAVAGKVLQITTRTNVRVVQCTGEWCRRLVPPGCGRRVYVDGFRRGFACQACRWSAAESRIREGT